MFAAPAVAGDEILVGSCNGFFRAFDRESGRLKWAYDTRADGAALEFHGEPWITPELAVVGSDLREDGATAYVYAFERTTGAARWKTPIQIGSISDGLSQGGDLWILTMEGKLLDLELASGKIRWTLDTSTTAPNLQFRTSNPASDGRRIFVAAADGNLRAVDARTGQTLWRRELGSRPMTSVLLHGGTLYVGTYDRQLFGISADKGEVQFRLRLSEIPLSSLAFVDKRLIFFLGEKSVAAADPALEKVLWKHDLASTLSTAKPVVWRGSVLVGDESGEFRALDPGDGQLRWSAHFPKMVRGIGVSDRTLYLGTLQGTLYAWSPPESRGSK